MSIKLDEIKDKLCHSFCADIHLVQKKDDLLLVETPFHFPDGDPYQIYIKLLPTGLLRLTDMGHTLMHLSYENDIEKFKDGTRGQILQEILDELDIQEDQGQYFVESSFEDLSKNILKVGQAFTKIYDLTFLNRVRVQSTFYEDLREELTRHIPSEKIHPDYIYPQLESAANDYPIDYYIEGKTEPLYVFGIPNRDKALLTNIVLERLLRANAVFESILIFQDMTILPRQVLSRLTNAGGEMIASLDAQEDLKRKLLKRVA